MRFFGREKEICLLRNIRDLSNDVAQFTVITGRRRIGKTSLVLKAYENTLILYFFVTRKAEKDLCESFANEITEKLNLPILGELTSFTQIFKFLMQFSEKQSITLVIDEFQEFYRVNSSVFSEMQQIWDLYHGTSKINLVVCGSIYSMMNRIFCDKKEPLFNRQTQFIHLKPFTPSVLKLILAEYNPKYKPEDLLALYTFTGGVAKYVQLLVDNKAITKEEMLNHIIKQDSVFIGEGKNILIEEFGRDYSIYFSILSVISRGRTSRSEIEQFVGREIAGYLTRLEIDYNLISKVQPLFEKTTSKNVRYTITDNFLRFWFRFVYKYNYIIEIDGYEQLKAIVNRDYDTFSGIALERYFYDVLMERQQSTRIGRWWDRKGENEIDLVSENELENIAVFYEVKRSKRNIDLNLLKKKSYCFLKTTGEFQDYTLYYEGLSLDDM